MSRGHRCIVRIVGLGFKAGDLEDSILNDSLFMAQVCLPQVCAFAVVLVSTSAVLVPKDARHVMERIFVVIPP